MGLCGKLPDARGGCRCSSTQVQRYLSKVSGPLLDRIDLHIEVPAQPFETLTEGPSAESSSTIRARVQRAIAWRDQRGQSQPNARLSAKDLKTHCQLSPEATKLLRMAMQELELSARSYGKILKSRGRLPTSPSSRPSSRTTSPKRSNTEASIADSGCEDGRGSAGIFNFGSLRQ